jgi:hypothetical protein
VAASSDVQKEDGGTKERREGARDIQQFPHMDDAILLAFLLSCTTTKP